MRAGVLALAFAALACAHVPTFAPHDREVRLMSGGERAAVSRPYRAWFALWGLVRLSGKEPADVIRDEGLCAARVRVEDNVPDAFIGAIYTVIEPIGIVPQTIVVEGNRGGCI